MQKWRRGDVNEVNFRMTPDLLGLQRFAETVPMPHGDCGFVVGAAVGFQFDTVNLDEILDRVASETAEADDADAQGVVMYWNTPRLTAAL